MNLLSPKIIKELLTQYNAEPQKRLGQNFLINPGVLKKIIGAANLSQEDLALEIGPGIGTLTQELAKCVKKVIAIEKDRKMVEILKETMADFKNVEIIQGDILKFSNKSQILKYNSPQPSLYKREGAPPFFQRGGWGALNYKVVANLPYYITSSVIRKFLESENPPSEMILMVQKEVAQRICASPPNMSLLAVSVQFYALPKIICYVSRGSFWPMPKVDSAILKIIPKNSSLYKREAGRASPKAMPAARRDFPDPQNPPPASAKASVGTQSSFKKEGAERFFKIVKVGFSSPRKQLVGNLSRGLKIERIKIEKALKEAGIEPNQRAETLEVEEWIELTPQLNQK